MKHVLKVCLSSGLLAFLSACGNAEQEELSAWMQSERNSIKPEVKPIPEPTKFQPHAYGGERFQEPFSNEKLAAILRSNESANAANAALVQPELNRRKQPLEAFPLDSMVMVGSLRRDGKLVALVKVDALLHQVSAGSYLGQNFGRVMRIDENQIVLREIVQDAAGEWIERQAALQLQEEMSK
jgi:type IV pilus assembly protein PilP